MKTASRRLSYVLVIALIVTMLPFSTFAEDGSTTFNAVANVGTETTTTFGGSSYTSYLNPSSEGGAISAERKENNCTVEVNADNVTVTVPIDTDAGWVVTSVGTGTNATATLSENGQSIVYVLKDDSGRYEFTDGQFSNSLMSSYATYSTTTTLTIDLSKFDLSEVKWNTPDDEETGDAFNAVANVGTETTTTFGGSSYTSYLNPSSEGGAISAERKENNCTVEVNADNVTVTVPIDTDAGWVVTSVGTGTNATATLSENGQSIVYVLKDDSGRYEFTDGQFSNSLMSSLATYSTTTTLTIDLSKFDLSEVKWPDSKASEESDVKKYTLTANLYVGAEDAPIGKNAYMTNTQVPPIDYVPMNATMTIDSDGTKLVTVPVVQEVFTLQDIDDENSGTEIVSIVRGGQDAPYGPYSDRIIEITFKLLNDSGHYRFESCHQYPTLLIKDQYWGMYLDVYFDSAVLCDDYTKEYSDSESGWSAKLTVSSDSSVSEELKTADMKVESVESGDDYIYTKTILSQRYKNIPENVKMYRITFWNGNEQIQPDEYVTVNTLSFQFDTNVENPTILYAPDGVLKIATTEIEAGILSAKIDDNLSIITVVPEEKSDDIWEITYSHADEETGIVQVARSIQGSDVDTAYKNFLSSDVVENEDMHVTAASLVENTGSFTNPEIMHVYGMSLMFIEDFPNDTTPTYVNKPLFMSTYGAIGLYNGEERGDYTALFPNTSSETKVYVMSGTPASGYILREVNVKDVGNGTISAELVPSDFDAVYDIRPNQNQTGSSTDSRSSHALTSFWQAMMQSKGIDALESYHVYSGEQRGKKTDENTRYDYVVLARETPDSVDKPASKTLVYSGQEQTVFEDTDAYTVTGNTATEAGTYVAKLTLNDGYRWSDGSEDEYNVVWYIAKGNNSSSGDSSTDTQGNVSQGTYSQVSANLYVPGNLNTVLGVNAYMCNENTPITTGTAPTAPVIKNADITVDSEGTATITLDIPNPVFTLQKIGGCSDAEVEVLETSEDLKFQGDAPSTAPTSRISKIKVTIKDFEWGKDYIFTDCEEYPTLLNTTWTVPLYLRIEKDGTTLSETSIDASKIQEVTGGGSDSSKTATNTYGNITVTSGSGGSVSIDNKNAAKGDRVTVTVTPDSGYAVDTLTITGKDGNAIDVTENADGTYSFTKPDGEVNIVAAFKKTGDASKFTDVPSNAYYGDAVDWAIEKGVTTGTTETTFSPLADCTRAQMVTFLWRAAGSPEPAGTTSAFTDIDKDAYYYNAVLWAVENGITKGTTETTFSPDSVCTRAQNVTFLWRAQGSPAAGTSSAFTDVSRDAYYSSAVDWAAEKGITTGTTEKTFSPSADCTRAQIVTFLYRMYK